MFNLGPDGSLQYQVSSKYKENVEKVLKPEKLFSSNEIKSEIKVGDSIEVCPGAITVT
jgi:hypothetical protein